MAAPPPSTVLEVDTAVLLHKTKKRWPQRPRTCFAALGLIGAACLLSVWVAPPIAPNLPAEPPAATYKPSASVNGTVEVYLGNGCFWERQWAYFNVETKPSGPFTRLPAAFSAKVGYAGGRAPPGAATTPVCYHTGDERDYSRLGHAEVVRVRLDAAAAEAQMAALAADYFASFTGRAGSRKRPDPMDRGSPYRSCVGLPGGVKSPLYAAFVKANDARYAMDLKPGGGSDADARNSVWVYDTRAFPFYDGEVYHQNHCNFFQSEGMPYPESYTQDVWTAKKASGEFVPTGCPEGVMPHPGSSCSGFAW